VPFGVFAIYSPILILLPICSKSPWFWFCCQLHVFGQLCPPSFDIKSSKKEVCPEVCGMVYLLVMGCDGLTNSNK